MTVRKSYLRYRDDVGMEHRCWDCREYWPLTPEFWDMKSFVRCRACWRKYKNRKQNEQYRADKEARARAKVYQAQYRKQARRAKMLYAQVYYWADPEKHRARAKARYYENREQILARKREQHAAKKAA